MIEAELKVALKPTVRALKTALARPIVPLIDRKRDACLTNVDVDEIELINDLKSEFFSASADAGLRESENSLARPLI